MSSVVTDAPSTIDPLRSLQFAADNGYGAYSTLQARVASGKLPARRVGRLLKVRQSDLDALSIAANSTFTREIDEAIDKVVAAAPPLSDTQREKLAGLLGGDR